MAKSDFSNPFDVWSPWYYMDTTKPVIVIEGNNMAAKKRMYEGPQCKHMVHPEDGSEPYRCRLGVWKEHPKDGLCFMHHPKVDYRGGAARTAIDRGDIEPKTSKARKRLKLNKKVTVRRRTKKKPVKETEKAPEQKPLDVKVRTFKVKPKGHYQVTFTEHKVVDEEGDIQAEGKVAFPKKQLAKGFYKVLTQATVMNPIINRDSLYFYSDVNIQSYED